jgi:hypothetical protein
MLQDNAEQENPIDKLYHNVAFKIKPDSIEKVAFWSQSGK